MGRGLSSRLVLCICCLLFATLPAFAQKITGDVEGNVTDSSGAVVPNVTITVQNAGTGLTRTATTSNSGGFRVTDLAVGSYKVTATAPGFKSVVRPVEVATGSVTHSDFVLQVGQRTETIEVEGIAPLVDLSPNNNNYIDSEKIQEIPLNGRDFNSLLAITPGVQRAPGGGFLAVSINGSRTTSNNYFIDGMYNNDRYYGDSAVNQTGVVGIPATAFPPEAIEELSVQETPSAEFGVKGGAPILLGIKSGTNQFHGSTTWVNHSGFGDATNYFSKHSGCNQPGSCQPTNIHNNQFNATLGGPIIKDRTFFFGSFEGQRLKSLAVSQRTVPSQDDVSSAIADITATPGLSVDPVGQKLLNYFPIGAGGNEAFVAQTPTSASSNGFVIKIDHKLNTQNSITGRYFFGDSFQSAPSFAGLPAGGSNNPNLFNSVAPTRVQMIGLSWTMTRNNRVLESRLGFTRFSQIIDVNNKVNPADLGVDTGPLSATDYGVPYVYLAPLGYGGYIGGVQGYPITTRPDQTWDWSEHFSWVKGNHTIKLGGNFQRAYTNSLRNRARSGLLLGYYVGYAVSGATGQTIPAIQAAVEELLLGRADGANRNFGDTHRHIFQNSVGFYGQDDWRVRSNLTVTLGLRWDINGALGERQNIGSNFIPGQGLVHLGSGGISSLYNLDLGDFGPRAGFSWDVFGRGKTAVRAGYSLTYDVANFGAIAAPYTFARARAGAFSQPNLGPFSSFSVSVFGTAANPNPIDPASTCYNPDNPSATTGDFLCFSKGPVFGSNRSGSPPYDAFSIVRNFKTPRYHNYNVSIQEELARNNVLTVGYSGQRGQNLVIYHDLNASPIGSGTQGPTGLCLKPSDCDPYRPYAGQFSPDLRHVIQAANGATSQYDSLQVSYNQRNWNGLDTQYNLTWSKCFDLNSVNRGGAGDYPQINNSNPVGSTAAATPNYQDSRGLCDHDVRLNFNVGGVYSLPDIPKLGRWMGRGWQLSTIFTAISGRPYSLLLGGGSDPSGQGLTGSAIRAAWDGTSLHYNTRNPDEYVSEIFAREDQTDPCGVLGPTFVDPNDPTHTHHEGGRPVSPFYLPCAASVGSSRRNQIVGPGLAQWDMTLSKSTKITEKVSLQFRWEVYNLLNRANFHYFPNNTIGNCPSDSVLAGGVCAPGAAGFNNITKTSDVASGNPVIAQGGPRNMNFSLKLIF
jgi:outer membrane receptor protein involved in Fe transport